MEIHAIRLKVLRRQVDTFPSIAAFARHYGVDGTYISQLLNGHRNLGEKAARNLERKLDWPPMSMDQAVDLDESLALETRFSTSLTRQAFSQSLRDLRDVPLISFVQAGLWREAVDSHAPGAGDEYLLTETPLGPHAFALTVRGESMQPEFREGDTIIVDPDVKPMPGDFVVAKNDENEATFKKYRPRGINEHGQTVIELVPLNEDFPKLRSDTTPIQIIGTMMEHRRYRKQRKI